MVPERRTRPKTTLARLRPTMLCLVLGEYAFALASLGESAWTTGRLRRALAILRPGRGGSMARLPPRQPRALPRVVTWAVAAIALTLLFAGRDVVLIDTRRSSRSSWQPTCSFSCRWPPSTRRTSRRVCPRRLVLRDPALARPLSGLAGGGRTPATGGRRNRGCDCRRAPAFPTVLRLHERRPRPGVRGRADRPLGDHRLARASRPSSPRRFHTPPRARRTPGAGASTASASSRSSVRLCAYGPARLVSGYELVGHSHACSICSGKDVARRADPVPPVGGAAHDVEPVRAIRARRLLSHRVLQFLGRTCRSSRPDPGSVSRQGQCLTQSGARSVRSSPRRRLRGHPTRRRRRRAARCRRDTCSARPLACRRPRAPARRPFSHRVAASRVPCGAAVNPAPS